MREIAFALAAAVVLALTVSGQSATTIPAGTVVRVKLLQFISSETSQPGDVVRFEVAQDVVLGNIVVISRRTPALGSIVKAKAYRKSPWQWPWWTDATPGRIVFDIAETRTVNGTAIHLSGPIEGANPSAMKPPRIRWYHEGELFDAIVLSGRAINSH
jgi:hypothetical protein